MTTRTDLPDLVGINEIHQRCGVGRQTVDKWRWAGKLPQADLMVSGSPLWLADTIRRWAEATGRRFDG